MTEPDGPRTRQQKTGNHYYRTHLQRKGSTTPKDDVGKDGQEYRNESVRTDVKKENEDVTGVPTRTPPSRTGDCK